MFTLRSERADDAMLAFVAADAAHDTVTIFRRYAFDYADAAHCLFRARQATLCFAITLPCYAKMLSLRVPPCRRDATLLRDYAHVAAHATPRHDAAS